MPPFQNYKQLYLFPILISGNSEDKSGESPRSLKLFESRPEIVSVKLRVRTLLLNKVTFRRCPDAIKCDTVLKHALIKFEF